MIECPICHAVSHHPVDAATGWCARCERFTGKTAAEVRAAARETENPAVAAAILRRLKTRGAKPEEGETTSLQMKGAR